MTSNAFGRTTLTAKESQFSHDRFEVWKKEQNESISNRGGEINNNNNNNNNEGLQSYLQHMIRLNLNAYICHESLDAYTSCLIEKKLIKTDGSIIPNDKDNNNNNVKDGLHAKASQNPYELNLDNKLHEKMCRASHQKYKTCLTSKQNQELLLQEASLHPHCNSRRNHLLLCMRENKEKEAESGQPQCEALYYSLMKCGLNHYWNDYWRALTKFTDKEEFMLYEVSRDENKKQNYLRVVSEMEKQQRSA